MPLLLCWLLLSLLVSEIETESVADGMGMVDEGVVEVGGDRSPASGKAGVGLRRPVDPLVRVASMSDVTCAVTCPAHRTRSDKINVK